MVVLQSQVVVVPGSPVVVVEVGSFVVVVGGEYVVVVVELVHSTVVSMTSAEQSVTVQSPVDPQNVG